ncbi:hypothetical protein PRZ48_014268 [Zasmidium cellare]|uniref:Uncharacterized protein n=1 Tax=Zasmidium cellare TaxID=395010 RepID=A0ABR0E0I2_ZASCE|nr:hypothetical protein PRZ48_014268 [Zasmidium cellare]
MCAVQAKTLLSMGLESDSKAYSTTRSSGDIAFIATVAIKFEMKKQELLFVACEGPTGRKDRKTSASANRHVQQHRTIRGKGHAQVRLPRAKAEDSAPVTKTEDDDDIDSAWNLSQVPSRQSPELNACNISTTTLADQSAGFDPFDSLSSCDASSHATQELLAWYSARAVPPESDNESMEILFASVWDGFWQMAMENGAFYHHLAAVINAPRKLEEPGSGWAGDQEKFMYHKALALQHLRRSLDSDRRYVETSAMILSVCFQLHFAMREGNREETTVHAAALKNFATTSALISMQPPHWITFVLLSLKHSQWSLELPPAIYCLHPSCTFEHLYIEAPELCSQARDKASSALSRLPLPQLPELDAATVYSIFFRMFLHCAIAQGSHGVGPMLGLFYDISYDLCTYSATVRKLLFEGYGKEERCLEALYCVLLAAQLSTWSLPVEFTGSKGHTTTNTTVRLLAETCASLKRQQNTVDYWREHTNLESLVWVLFLACGHWRLAEQAETYKPQGYMFCLFRRVTKQLGIKSGADLENVLLKFPWTESWCVGRLEELRGMLGLGASWNLKMKSEDGR